MEIWCVVEKINQDRILKIFTKASLAKEWLEEMGDDHKVVTRWAYTTSQDW